jgi:hypothetical protein
MVWWQFLTTIFPRCGRPSIFPVDVSKSKVYATCPHSTQEQLKDCITNGTRTITGALVQRGMQNFRQWLQQYIVAYRPAARQWICKQWLLLDNARNTHAANSTGTASSMSTDGPVLYYAHAVMSHKRVMGSDDMTCVYCDALSVPRL